MRLVLVIQCIIGLQSQSIELTNDFDQVDIPGGKPVFVDLTRYFKSDVGQYDDGLILKKSLYGQAKSTRICYEKLRNGLLDCGFVVIKMDPCMFISNTLIYVVYVDDCLFWAL